MKLFIATLTLATTIALPAVAQTYYDQPLRPGLRYIGPGAAYARAIGPYGAYAGPYAAYAYRPRSAYPGFDVYQDGRYVGSDPDPRVRTMMQNDDAMLGND
jgi:hypothetical protein